MPYTQNNELPKGVKDVLPTAAQNIFRRAFNSAEKKYNDERSFKIAWAAVKNAGYKKVEDKWVKESYNIDVNCINSSWSENTGLYMGHIYSDTPDIDVEKITCNLPNFTIIECNNNQIIGLFVPEYNLKLPQTLTINLTVIDT